MQYNISIIGFGNIGKAICTMLLAKKELKFTLNVVDSKSYEYITGTILDIHHGLELCNNHQLYYNNDELLEKADFVFHCAGASVPKGKSRLHTAQASIDITESIFSGLNFKNEPFVIVISNPVEVITSITQRLSQLPPHKVAGTGTMLDSLRMNYYVKQRMPNSNNVHCIVLGEHGETMFLSSQLTTIEGQSIQSHFSDQVIHDIMLQVQQSPAKIKLTQDATIYGVSLCALRIFEALLSDERFSAPVSIAIPQNLKNKIGLPEIALSLPTLINKSGVFFDEIYQPNDIESEQLLNSSNLLKGYL